MSAESYILPRHPGDDARSDSSLDSLPSSDASSDGDSEADREAQAEWERSIQQLQSLAGLVLIPFMGKWLGRQFAYWSWARYMEWMHGVEIVWTSKKAHRAVGAAEAAAAI
jgi:hypothetical protein